MSAKLSTTFLSARWNEMVFVDDKIENIEGAWNVGLYAILYNKKTIAAEIETLL